jgi:hypothetical protein
MLRRFAGIKFSNNFNVLYLILRGASAFADEVTAQRRSLERSSPDGRLGLPT